MIDPTTIMDIAQTAQILPDEVIHYFVNTSFLLRPVTDVKWQR